MFLGLGLGEANPSRSGPILETQAHIRPKSDPDNNSLAWAWPAYNISGLSRPLRKIGLPWAGLSVTCSDVYHSHRQISQQTTSTTCSGQIGLSFECFLSFNLTSARKRALSFRVFFFFRKGMKHGLSRPTSKAAFNINGFDEFNISNIKELSPLQEEIQIKWNPLHQEWKSKMHHTPFIQSYLKFKSPKLQIQVRPDDQNKKVWTWLKAGWLGPWALLVAG